MLSYAIIESEEPIKESKPPPMSQPQPQPQRKVRRLRLETETDYVVMAFVVGTIILLISDMMSKK